MKMKMQHEFVETIPKVLENHVLYISLTYSTAVHKCVCGCGNKVVTPITPTDWEFTYDGESVSLNPSIGNWSFDCKSHYWIKKSKIILSDNWDTTKIEQARKKDKYRKQTFFENKKNEDYDTNWFKTILCSYEKWKRNLRSFRGLKNNG